MKARFWLWIMECLEDLEVLAEVLILTMMESLACLNVQRLSITFLVQETDTPEQAAATEDPDTEENMWEQTVAIPDQSAYDLVQTGIRRKPDATPARYGSMEVITSTGNPFDHPVNDPVSPCRRPSVHISMIV